MKVDVSTELACSAAKAWDEVQTSALLLHVISPLAKIVPVGASAFPERWSEGLTVQCDIFLFGLIPTGTRSLHFAKIDQQAGEIRTHEHDRLVRRWDHVISVKPLGTDRSIYRDTIDLDAGALTPLVWAWSAMFYRHRQRRWRERAKTL